MNQERRTALLTYLHRRLTPGWALPMMRDGLLTMMTEIVEAVREADGRLSVSVAGTGLTSRWHFFLRDGGEVDVWIESAETEWPRLRAWTPRYKHDVDLPVMRFDEDFTRWEAEGERVFQSPPHTLVLEAIIRGAEEHV